MNKEKEIIIGIIESAAVELNTYLKIANNYAFLNCSSEAVLHLSLILDKMTEHIEKLHQLFMEDKINSLNK